MKGWKKADLSELLVLQRGFDITKAEQQEGNIPIISSSGISSYHNQAKCKAPGVITGRKGTLGKIFYSNDDYWPHDTTLWVKDFKNNSPKYSYYFLKILQLENYDVGASNPTLNRNHIHKLKIRIPDLKIQRKIAAVLSAYDDLIENNNRRIAILEKMAEELYREWFVRLRFPGHENVKIVKGVPEGWAVKRIGDVVERLKFGKIYRENELKPEGKVIVIDQSVNVYLGFHDGEADHFAANDKPIILFGDHSCKMQLMITPFSLAENVIPFVAKGKMPTGFLFFMIHNSIETTEYKRHWTELTNKKVYITSNELQKKFDEVVVNHIIKKEQLIKINRKLTQARDRILSRLMSGKIDLEKLNIQFPPSMEEE